MGANVTAGTLDRRVQFTRAAVIDDGFAQRPGAFVAHGSPVWAKKADISDGERWRAGEVAAHITARFTVRWSSFTTGITPKDRLTCEGRDYDISGVKEIGRRDMLEITAAARVDE